MMGMYREITHGRVSVYELLAIERDSAGPVLKIKHFGPNLLGREDKDGALRLPLVAVARTEAVFAGTSGVKPLTLTYRTAGRDSLVALLERERNGAILRSEFRFRRTTTEPVLHE
jgi:hypothetical protein